MREERKVRKTDGKEEKEREKVAKERCLTLLRGRKGRRERRYEREVLRSVLSMKQLMREEKR